MAFAGTGNKGSHRPHRSTVGNSLPTARARAIESFDERQERCRLRYGHDRLERQRGAIRVVPIGDSAAIIDAGLKELAGLDQLRSMNLMRTPVTDAGLDILTNCKRQQTLDLTRVRVSDAAETFRKKLPRLTIERLHVGFALLVFG
jgi:hypothetical protein